jgi:hypothetical protein
MRGCASEQSIYIESQHNSHFFEEMALYLPRSMMWAGETGDIITATHLLSFSVMEFIYFARCGNFRNCACSPSTGRTFAAASWGASLLCCRRWCFPEQSVSAVDCKTYWLTSQNSRPEQVQKLLSAYSESTASCKPQAPCYSVKRRELPNIQRHYNSYCPTGLPPHLATKTVTC